MKEFEVRLWPGGVVFKTYGSMEVSTIDNLLASGKPFLGTSQTPGKNSKNVKACLVLKAVRTWTDSPRREGCQPLATLEATSAKVPQSAAGASQFHLNHPKCSCDHLKAFHLQAIHLQLVAKRNS